MAAWCAAFSPARSDDTAPRTENPPPRPERTDAERLSTAGRLREIYRRDPASWPKPSVDPGIEWKEIGLLPAVRHPESNPYSPEKEALGKTLFFDERLASAGTMACASCHDPRHGWAAGPNDRLGKEAFRKRNAPTVRNAAFQRLLFWDGRAESLEQQAEEAMLNPDEMAVDREKVVRQLSASPGYRRLFDAAFPGSPIRFEAAVEALACFERTIVSGRSQFDSFVRGKTSALSDRELLGLDLFRRDARCMNCHHGPTFSDGRFHDLGLSFYGRQHEDVGRRAVTKRPEDTGRFRTPSLRDVTRTAPLMHTGTFELSGVLNMYNAGMPTVKREAWQRDDPLFPVKSPHLKPLGLNRQDLADLAAFLMAIEEPLDGTERPPLPELDERPVGGTGVSADP